MFNPTLLGSLLSILMLLAYVGVAAFLVYMVWRFVKAHESIAESMSELAQRASNSSH